MAKISKSTASKAYNKKTVAKMQARDASNSSSKLGELESVTAKAKALGIDTGRAESMIAQTRAEGSKPYAGSSFEKNYLSSIPTVMQQETPANIPTLPTTPNYGDIVGSNNQAMTSLLGQGTTYDPSKGFTTAPQTDNFQSLFEQATALGNQAFQDMGTDEARLAKLEKENQIKQKQNAVNDYTSQLNAIVAKQQQDLLRVEGQGRGIPDVIIGGQQAQINKEAAIAALPIQAQLAAAQGALEMAQSHVDKMFQIQSQDALAKYQYKSKLIDSVYQFATGQEQRRLDALKTKEDRAYDMQKTNLSLQNEWAQTAIGYGQSSLAGQIMKLDPKSATFQSDLSALQGRVVKPMATTSGGFEVPTVKTINGVDMQWNSQTGQWENIAGSQQGAQSAENLDSKYTSLLSDIADARALSNAVGAGKMERTWDSLWTSNPDWAQVQNIADTIKSNLLTLNTDPNIKKFFGPQMSNRDTELMTAAGSTLNPEKQTPEQFLRDLNDAANLIARSREAVRKGMGAGVRTLAPDAGMSRVPMNIVVAPNGMEIQIID